VDNDSAQVTSSGRSFNVHGLTTGKARLGEGMGVGRSLPVASGGITPGTNVWH